MARTLTHISDLNNSLPIEKVKVLSFTEELEKINKIKLAFSFSYFIGLVIFTGTMFL
ncbi:MAG: hypothetical protein OQJ81_12310 [Melioribacteraceae bacterium]|nr:hypothetical protein [Melioribacteraceae bacterium]